MISSKTVLLALSIIVCLALFFVVMDSNKQIERAKRIPGRWRTKPLNSENKNVTPEQEKLIKQLESIGYLSGSKPAPQKKNVTIYNKDRAYNGLNLFASGHLPEAILMDMQGNTIHTWSYDFRRIWPRYKTASNKSDFWRHVHLYENGDLLAIFEGIGLIKIDKNSNLLWVFSGKAHHDLAVNQNGNIYVLTRKAAINKRYNKEKPILEDFVSVLEPNGGKEIKRISILKSLENSSYSPILYKMKKAGDILHTNTIEILDGKLEHKSTAFKKGNLLLSILYLDTICVLDMQAEKVVWALQGLWRRQHHPKVLQNGNILLFDNKGHNGRSKVIEFDPFSQNIIWVYADSKETPLYTYDCGYSERLPNGNTLITESNRGRAFEVAYDKTIVWEFVNPHRAGKNNEFIATLFEVNRLSPDFPLDWLDNKPDISLDTVRQQNPSRTN